MCVDAALRLRMMVGHHSHTCCIGLLGHVAEKKLRDDDHNTWINTCAPCIDGRTDEW